MKSFLPAVRSAVMATLVLATVTCGLYPAVVWAFAQLLFPSQANGSLIVDATGTTRGSRLIGQRFTRPGYFHSRPSAAGDPGYDGLSSGGSNLGPTSRKLRDQLRERIATYRAENHLDPDIPVPADAVTASASGLDPHISQRNAELQIPRIAAARGLDRERLLQLLKRHLDEPTFGILGEPVVNVLELNRALDQP